MFIKSFVNSHAATFLGTSSHQRPVQDHWECPWYFLYPPGIRSNCQWRPYRAFRFLHGLCRWL